MFRAISHINFLVDARHLYALQARLCMPLSREPGTPFSTAQSGSTKGEPAPEGPSELRRAPLGVHDREEGNIRNSFPLPASDRVTLPVTLSTHSPPPSPSKSLLLVLKLWLPLTLICVFFLTSTGSGILLRDIETTIKLKFCKIESN